MKKLHKKFKIPKKWNISKDRDIRVSWGTLRIDEKLRKFSIEQRSMPGPSASLIHATLLVHNIGMTALLQPPWSLALIIHGKVLG